MTARLGYFGPAGTFTHAALRASGHVGEAVPFATERETILAAESGAVDAALVPIENSLEGGVNATLDALIFGAEGVHIVGEEVLPVSHALIARPDVALEDLAAVASHPQALAQCRRWLAEQLPGRSAIAATSTAEAVRVVATGDAPHAAIGTTTAAEIYGGAVLAEGIEDEHGNQTRFLWVAASGTAPFAAAAASPARALPVPGRPPRQRRRPRGRRGRGPSARPLRGRPGARVLPRRDLTRGLTGAGPAGFEPGGFHCAGCYGSGVEKPAR